MGGNDQRYESLSRFAIDASKISLAARKRLANVNCRSLTLSLFKRLSDA